MSRMWRMIGLIVAVAAVSATACFLTMRLGPVPRGKSHADAHLWIHTQLELTAEQEKQLVPIEHRYHEEKKHLGELIRLANMELAQALLDDQRDSPRVKAAVAKIHEAQGKLQDATLRHVFEMKPILQPEQYQKLLNLTANALYEVNRAQ